MNYFLTLIIILLGTGGYYEYGQLQQKIAADQQQIIELTDKADKLGAENTKLTGEMTELTRSVTDAQAQVTGINLQLQSAQNALADAKRALAQAQMAAAPQQSPAPAPPPSPNNLGAITTVDGKTYMNCQLLKVQADGIVVSHSQGILKLAYPLLPPEVQKKFGYDSHVSLTLTDDEVQALEDQRKAAGGN